MGVKLKIIMENHAADPEKKVDFRITILLFSILKFESQLSSKH